MSESNSAPRTWVAMKAISGTYDRDLMDRFGRFMSTEQRERFVHSERVYLDPVGHRIRFVHRTYGPGLPMETVENLRRPSGVTFEARFEPRDAWIGLFWDRRKDGLHVYVCPVPFWVLHWTFRG